MSHPVSLRHPVGYYISLMPAELTQAMRPKPQVLYAENLMVYGRVFLESLVLPKLPKRSSSWPQEGRNAVSLFSMRPGIPEVIEDLMIPVITGSSRVRRNIESCFHPLGFNDIKPYVSRIAKAFVQQFPEGDSGLLVSQFIHRDVSVVFDEIDLQIRLSACHRLKRVIDFVKADDLDNLSVECLEKVYALANPSSQVPVRWIIEQEQSVKDECDFPASVSLKSYLRRVQEHIMGKAEDHNAIYSRYAHDLRADLLGVLHERITTAYANPSSYEREAAFGVLKKILILFPYLNSPPINEEILLELHRILIDPYQYGYYLALDEMEKKILKIFCLPDNKPIDAYLLQDVADKIGQVVEFEGLPMEVRGAFDKRSIDGQLRQKTAMLFSRDVYRVLYQDDTYWSSVALERVIRVMMIVDSYMKSGKILLYHLIVQINDILLERG